jgi:hypothetical protein
VDEINREPDRDSGLAGIIGVTIAALVAIVWTVAPYFPW